MGGFLQGKTTLMMLDLLFAFSRFNAELNYAIFIDSGFDTYHLWINWN